MLLKSQELNLKKKDFFKGKIILLYGENLDLIKDLNEQIVTKFHDEHKIQKNIFEEDVIKNPENIINYYLNGSLFNEDKNILIDVTRESDGIYNDESSSFLKQFTKHIDRNIFILFPKKRDAQIADAIMELFRKHENLDIFNKKALYIYIKEITDATTPQITKIIKRLKIIYIKKYNEYYEHGFIN